MPHGAQQFTPQQLLQAGRRAEAEGRTDLAYQFYWHLSDQYGYTTEAADARNGLARVGAMAPPQGAHTATATSANLPALTPGGHWSATRRRRAKSAAVRVEYRSGRALATLASGIGWVMIVAAVAVVVIGIAAYAAPIALLRDIKLTYGVLLYAAGALPGGAALVLFGQAARALFDQANATRELVALARAKRGNDPP